MAGSSRGVDGAQGSTHKCIVGDIASGGFGLTIGSLV